MSEPIVVTPIAQTLSTTAATVVTGMDGTLAVKAKSLTITCLATSGTLYRRFGASGTERPIPASTDGNASYTEDIPENSHINTQTSPLYLRASVAPMNVLVEYVPAT
jgi:hypothetical protein